MKPDEFEQACLLVPKGIAQPGTAAVVAALELSWRTGIPVSVERQVPVNFAKHLQVVGCIDLREEASRFCHGRYQAAGEIESSLLEGEDFQIGGDYRHTDVLRPPILCRGSIVRALPPHTARSCEADLIRVLQIAPQANTENGLALDFLHRTLQQPGNPGEEIVLS